MQSSSAYITEAPTQQDNPLRAYVNVLDAKMDYARWKQNLVLSYNYMPLANIKEKLQNDRMAYLKKMEAEEAYLSALVDNKEITTLLAQLSSFRAKLLQNADRTEKKIQEQKIILHQLKQQAINRRETLKQILRNTKQMTILKLEQQGIKSARDLKSLIRSKSTVTKAGSYTSRPTIKQQRNSESLLGVYTTCIKALLKEKRQAAVYALFKQKLKRGQEKSESNYQSVPTKIVERYSEMKWEEFASLSFDQIVRLINQMDPLGEALSNLLKFEQ